MKPSPKAIPRSPVAAGPRAGRTVGSEADRYKHAATRMEKPKRLSAVCQGVGRLVSSQSGAAIILLGLLIWAYWPVVRPLYRDWQNDQNYSVCQLVPLAALWLIWRDRARLARLELAPCWGGIALILLAQAAVGFGLVYMFESAERYSLILMIAGVVLLVGGRGFFWDVKWILLLLLLMVPLPGRIHNLISDPLQSLSAQGAVMVLELVGITTLREGNILVLNGNTSVAVAEACSGLRMLTAFVVVAYVFACLINRPPWQRLVLVLSSVPVAILCNLVRLVVTALLFLATSSELAEAFFHDFAGITMMPLAVLALVGELWIMSRLVIEEKAGSTITHSR